MDVTVALGGGGARGFAHIGVLRVLEREGFRIRAIAGTSMGGVIAAVYAAGYSPDEIEKHSAAASLPDLIRSRPVGPGLIGVRKIEAFLRKHLDDRDFDDMRIPLALTAVNLADGAAIVLRQGRVIEAVMATTALPGIFPPYVLGEHRLLDGGVIDPVPVAAVRTLHAAPVVAVALSPAPENWAETRSPASLGLPLLGLVSRLRPAEVLTIALRAVEITARSMTELRLQIDRPDVVIRPSVSHVGLLEGVRVAEVAALGQAAAEAALPQLRDLFTPRRRLERGLQRAFGGER
jgi:NTE family protein